MAKMEFSLAPINYEEKANVLKNSMVKLTQMAMNKYHGDNILCKKYVFSETENYKDLNDTVKSSLLKYACEKSGLTHLDMTKKEDVHLAFTNESFRWHFFAIQTQALQDVNSDNEVEDILMLANTVTVGIGDSWTAEISSKSLYNVQDGAYGNLVSRFQEHFKSPVTITPTQKICRIDFDVNQIMALDYDFGREIAKVAMSFRTRMYKDITDALYLTSNLSGTPLYQASFTKTNYTDLATRVDRANGGLGVMAYGTRQAFISMSDGISNGYATQDEINKTGFIGNLYGVTSMLIGQAVDSTTANLNFQVPNDRIIVMSAVTDKPIKLVREGQIFVVDDDGRNNSLYKRTYTYVQNWAVGLATQAAYGIQSV